MDAVVGAALHFEKIGACSGAVHLHMTVAIAGAAIVGDADMIEPRLKRRRLTGLPCFGDAAGDALGSPVGIIGRQSFDSGVGGNSEIIPPEDGHAVVGQIGGSMGVDGRKHHRFGCGCIGNGRQLGTHLRSKRAGNGQQVAGRKDRSMAVGAFKCQNIDAERTEHPVRNALKILTAEPDGQARSDIDRHRTGAE